MNNIDIQDKLKKYIEDKFYGECLDIVKQYSCFEYHDGKGWYFNCLVGGCNDESIYDINIFNNNNKKRLKKTRINFKSWKGNYDNFTFKLSDINLSQFIKSYKNNSDDIVIYSIDLYPDYKPKHFNCEIYTRNGSSGWNWISD